MSICEPYYGGVMRESTERVNKVILLEVKSGKIRRLPWYKVFVNEEGYLFIPDGPTGDFVWVQLVGQPWLNESAEA